MCAASQLCRVLARRRALESLQRKRQQLVAHLGAAAEAADVVLLRGDVVGTTERFPERYHLG